VTENSRHYRSEIQWNLFKFNIIWCGIAVGFGLQSEVYEALLLPPIISFMLLTYWYHQGIVLILDTRVPIDNKYQRIGEILDEICGGNCEREKIKETSDSSEKNNQNLKYIHNFIKDKENDRTVAGFIKNRTNYRRNAIKWAFVANFIFLPLLSLLLLVSLGATDLEFLVIQAIADCKLEVYPIFKLMLVISVFILDLGLLVSNYININRWGNYEYSFKHDLIKEVKKNLKK